MENRGLTETQKLHLYLKTELNNLRESDGQTVIILTFNKCQLFIVLTLNTFSYLYFGPVSVSHTVSPVGWYISFSG